MSQTVHEALSSGADISICDACAVHGGGVWPDCHVATFWFGKCGVCGEEKSVCSLSDWHWPGRRGRAMQAQREF